MPRQKNKQNSFLLSGDGEWHTDGPVLVDRYTYTRQRWLRAKIVKSGHGRHYKEAFAVWRKGGRKAPQYWKLENQEIEKPGLRKRSRKKKIIKGNIRKEGKKKIES